MTANIRTLTRCFWVMVEDKEKTTKEVIEKASAINLLVAFAYATRNYLREEYSYDEDNLRELISHIPKLSTPSSNQPLKNQEHEKASVLVKKGKTGDDVSGSRKDVELNWKSTINSTASASSSKKTHSISYKAYEKPVPTNIPIELSYYIASYINNVRLKQLVDPATATLMNNSKYNDSEFWM